jgi:hypothetical protein
MRGWKQMFRCVLVKIWCFVALVAAVPSAANAADELETQVQACGG